MLIFLDMDAVFIATPTAMHAEHALTALQERRHVYLEKPPALSLDQARRIEEMATEQERIVHVGLQHRYSDLVPPFYQALEGRNISVVHVHLYRGVLDSAEEWGDELVGGVLFEEAFHLLDLVRFLVDEVVAVGAFTGQALWRDMPAWRSRDSAAIAFQLASGGCGTLTLTQAMSLPLPGHLAMDVVAEGPVLARFTGEQLQVATEAGVETWTVEKPPLMTAVARFLEGVRSSNQGVLLVPYADVVRTLELVLACGRSVVEGRVVYLDV
jgi:predicted dehydrogenase